MRKVFLIMLLFSTSAIAQHFADVDSPRVHKIVKRTKCDIDTLYEYFNYEWFNPTKVSLTGNLGAGYVNLVVVGTLPFSRPAVEWEEDGTNQCLPLTWMTDPHLATDDTVNVGIYYRGANPGGVDTGHVLMRVYHCSVDSGMPIPAIYPDSINMTISVRADTIFPIIIAKFYTNGWNNKTFHFFTIRRIDTSPLDNYTRSIYCGRIWLSYWRVR